ncbi:MAG TPA: hypothetical protein VMG60_10780 [Burkholderiaceae bacterium]|nr:hypothetical protein [Burkholderiaceae bacterium]
MQRTLLDEAARPSVPVSAPRVLDVARTIEHVVGAIDAAPEYLAPFRHLRFAGLFPADVYAAMLEALPTSADYGEMSGRARDARAYDGGSARTKVDLFPEGMLRLRNDKKAVWEVVGRVLRSGAVRDAFVRRLAPGLEQRFGAGYKTVRMYSIPLLTRDVPGYSIGVHPDTAWKGITVQIYLPADDSIAHIGTVFHTREPDGSYKVAARMTFLPNSGYAFAVGTDTYHSVDTVGPEVRTRDSILLNYFVDDTFVQITKNRFKRLGNLMRGLGWRRARLGD